MSGFWIGLITVIAILGLVIHAMGKPAPRPEHEPEPKPKPVERTCVTCRFYRHGFLGATCTNPKCDERGFTYHDRVTGEVRHHPRRHTECYKARWRACGAEGKFWNEPPANL